MSVDARSLFSVNHPIVLALARLRFTILFLAVMLVANLLAGSLHRPLTNRMLENWGIGHDTLMRGDALRLITSTFLSHDPDMLLRQFVFAAMALGYTELKFGSGRTIALFLGLDIIGTLILLALVGLLSGTIDLTAANDVGMSIGGFGLVGLAIADWRGRSSLFAAILVGIAMKFAYAPDLMADGGHVLAFGLGYVLGLLLSRRKRTVSKEPGYAR